MKLSMYFHQVVTIHQKKYLKPLFSVLFNDTIYNNIRYGNLNATENQIIEAAKVADLHRSVAEMKQGYQTVVGERGVKLSGGEKQRLAIARCFLKDPKIVIYDEATSSLDSVTEQVRFFLKNLPFKLFSSAFWNR